MDGINFSPRNAQQLINNALKQPEIARATLTTTSGDAFAISAPIELGTDCIAFKDPATGHLQIVPYHAIARIALS